MFFWDGIAIGEALGARSGLGLRCSGVCIAKVIVVPPWDSPAGLAGMSGSTASSLLFPNVTSHAGRLLVTSMLRLIYGSEMLSKRYLSAGASFCST
jgi:hypothetical protein